jgi:glycosyltransferase involved in cell wall biosynthesis
MEDAVEALLPNHPHITLVPFGVDTARFTPAVIMAPSAKIRIGFVKSFAQKYAPDIFVEAAALAAKDCDNIEFIMAGRGPLLDEIRLLAVNKGLEDRISFSGFIPHDEVASFMRTLDVLVNCSRTESFGVVICEASASGLPVIATDVGGVRETLLDGETGILVPSEDPKALAKAMIKLAANTEMRERMGSAGRKFIAAAYEWNQCIDLMTDVLERAAAKNCHNVSYYRSNPNSESASAFDL